MIYSQYQLNQMNMEQLLETKDWCDKMLEKHFAPKADVMEWPDFETDLDELL